MSEQHPQNWAGAQMDDHADDQPKPSFKQHDFRKDTFEDTNMAGLDYSGSDFRQADLTMAICTGEETWDGCNFYRAKVSPALLATLKKASGVTLPDGTRNPKSTKPKEDKLAN
jgi:uncharacterized protein YjbI with pentapeptide repeats